MSEPSLITIVQLVVKTVKVRNFHRNSKTKVNSHNLEIERQKKGSPLDMQES